MAGINHVVLVGNLTRDAELKFTNAGLAISKFSLAVNRRTKKGDTWQDEVDFFDAVFMGKGAEAVSQYLLKGKQVGIQGELRQNRWEQEGQKRSKVEIFVTNLQLLGGGRGGGQAAPAEPGGGDVPQSAPGSPAPGTSADDFNDDIPF
ncbi:MAG: single-stranded DNA-binding protein [Spirochaetes bacterium GWB1_66_5]|jgi:single-strand DNA-binding protein|nr:MAG: single-stranded DNA-binding protein [Spirochaetes bacterium GWB1_66_5]